VCEDHVEKLKDYIQVRQIFVFVVYEKFETSFYLDLLLKPLLLKHFFSPEEVVGVGSF
jgi:hypothetical protein